MTDLPGKAIHDFHSRKKRHKLFVHDMFGPKVEMPVSYYFRNYNKMPELEQKALELCEGKILDIGAAAGSHALELQSRGFDITALEISPNACEVISDRGLNQVVCEDIFNFKNEKFDTLLLLMNGIGISSTVSGFKNFLKKSESLLTPGGRIIFDSCDISYMYEDVEMPENHYYGEVKCRYEYAQELTDWFQWLYLDQNTMRKIATKENWYSEIVFEDENNQYLAVLKKNS